MLTLCILKSLSCLVLRETLSLETKERPSVTAAVGLNLDFQVIKNIEFEVPMYPPPQHFFCFDLFTVLVSIWSM